MKFNFKLNWLRIFTLFILSIVIYSNAKLALWKQKGGVIQWDVVSYYAYLPATFIHGDLSLDFMNTDKVSPNEIYWPCLSPTGKKVIKTSMGLSILYSPFFLVAHAIAPFTKYNNDGYTQPYQQLLVLSSIFYLALGLYFLRKFLQKYFEKYLIGITMFSIILGTNIFLYSTLYSTLSHTYNFFLFCTFIFMTPKWFSNPNYKNSIIIGLLTGLISLIRPTNAIIVLFFIFFEITSLKIFKERMLFFLNHYQKIIIIVLVSILIWVPQIIYWKAQTGQFFYYSYQNERFFFEAPNILNNLFSFRNGWLIYTPIISFSLVGTLFLIKKNNRMFFLPVLLFTIFNIYIISSWWCWWYTGYSIRAYIESYAILSIPFIFLLREIKNWSKIVFSITLFFILILIGLNLFQSRQYYFNAIHYDSMTKESYIESFGKLHPTDKYYESLLPPNHFNAQIGISENIYEKRVFFCGAEKLDSSKNNFISEFNKNIIFNNAQNRTDEEHFKGKYSIKLDEKNPNGFTCSFNNLKYEDKLNITVWRLDKFDSNDQARIICCSSNAGVLYSYGYKVIKELPNGWKKIQLKLIMPFVENETVNIYVTNPNKNPVYFDNFLIETDKVLTNLNRF